MKAPFWIVVVGLTMLAYWLTLVIIGIHFMVAVPGEQRALMWVIIILHMLSGGSSTSSKD